MVRALLPACYNWAALVEAIVLKDGVNKVVKGHANVFCDPNSYYSLKNSLCVLDGKYPQNILHYFW